MKTKTPREARALGAISKLPRDNVTIGEYCFLLNSTGTVVITRQKVGESPSAEIELPRSVFNRFVDWYNTGKWWR